MNSKGISIIICCYNSSSLIERTLKCIADQQFDGVMEVIVVNNNSSDDTQERVQAVFDTYFTKIPHKLIDEPNPGLIYARNKGIKESSHELVLFCDDDNLLNNDYVSRLFAIMNSDHRIGACGGCGLPLIEGEVPEWFKHYDWAYALGKQLAPSGKVESNCLYGAGVCFRREALDALANIGFTSLLTGRKGKILLAGEDNELTKAIVLLGYQLYADNEAYFRHVLPSQRLNLPYLKKMLEGFAQADGVMAMYDFALQKKKGSLSSILWRHLLSSTRRYGYTSFLYLFTSKEKLQIKRAINRGRIKGFILFSPRFLIKHYKRNLIFHLPTTTGNSCTKMPD